MIEIIDIIDITAQTVIVFTGIFSIYFMSSPEARRRRRGAVIGLVGEPFWLTTALINGQVGVVVLVIIYGVNWARAFYINHKLVKEEEKANE